MDLTVFLSPQTNYSSTFVENSKLKRLLLKIEKDIEQLQAQKARREKSASKLIRALLVSTLDSTARAPFHMSVV